MAIVPLDDIWITANFKETQLKDMRIGQPVTIEVDAYGRKYTGKVFRIAGASGAKLSLLPPENAATHPPVKTGARGTRTRVPRASD